MQIKSVQIQNFRSFRDQTVHLNRYSCFVGPNGAGKSSILCALNVFFREQAFSATDVVKLAAEDYYAGETANPIRVTVTFHDLTPEATTALGAYVRNGELVVTAEAAFDPALNCGQVRHFGQRRGMTEFRPFFQAVKAGESAAGLNAIYDSLRDSTPELPTARSKEAKVEALRQFEDDHPERGVLIESEDDFYGVNSTGKLSPFVQWVYVPAVKDADEEGKESKGGALGKLIARVVRTRTNFDAELEDLKRETLTRYQDLLNRNQDSLNGLSDALQRRLESWAHPNVRLGMEWMSDPNKSVLLQQPIAGIKTGDGDFLGSLNRMGHGLQRSYLLALLQELAGSESPNAPTLILGCEEPELYQHPPQARHLADVFSELANRNNQILVTTHSPLFVSGEGFENTRMVRRGNAQSGSLVTSLTFENLCNRLRTAVGSTVNSATSGLVARIHQALQPGISEMFFSRVPIFVEGQEDVAYITTALHLHGQWSEFRRLGCHFIPVNGKDKLIQPLAIAIELGLPFFLVFDADGNTTKPEHRSRHERDNTALFHLLANSSPAFPTSDIWAVNHTVWQSTLTDTVRAEYANDHTRLTEASRLNYAQEGGLDKNCLFIADWLTAAHSENLVSETLRRLCSNILTHASTSRG